MSVQFEGEWWVNKEDCMTFQKRKIMKRTYMNSQSNVLLSDGSEHLPGVDDALVLDAQTAHQHVGKVHEWIAL